MSMTKTKKPLYICSSNDHIGGELYKQTITNNNKIKIATHFYKMIPAKAHIVRVSNFAEQKNDTSLLVYETSDSLKVCLNLLKLETDSLKLETDSLKLATNLLKLETNLLKLAKKCQKLAGFLGI